MIDAPAGTGQIFTMCARAAYVRARTKFVFCTASTGIVALLLPGGLTAHFHVQNTFYFRDNLVESSWCNLKAESDREQGLRQAELVAWDELRMSNKLAPEPPDLTLKVLRGNIKPFSGATILFSGDRRQIDTVIPLGTADDVVDASFVSSHLWKHVQRFRLTAFTRVRLDKPYPETARAIGEGNTPPVVLLDGSYVISLCHLLPTIITITTQTSTTITIIISQHVP